MFCSTRNAAFCFAYRKAKHLGMFTYLTLENACKHMFIAAA